MTGVNGAKFKIMPDSPQADLKKIEEKAKSVVEKFGGRRRGD